MVWRADSICTPELLASVPSSRYPVADAEGMSLIEVMIACGVTTVLVGMALPIALTTRDEWSVRAAARYVVSQAMLVRSEAVRRGASIGLHFELTADGYEFTSYVDGDVDGIRTRDIVEGVDTEFRPAQRIADHFPSVRFGLEPDFPPVDRGRAGGLGFDPIRLGPSDILTYTPLLGTATSGSLYLSGRTRSVIRHPHTRHDRSFACPALRFGGGDVERALRVVSLAVTIAAAEGVSHIGGGSAIPSCFVHHQNVLVGG